MHILKVLKKNYGSRLRVKDVPEFKIYIIETLKFYLHHKILFYLTRYIVRTCFVSISFGHFLAKCLEIRGIFIFLVKAMLKSLQLMRMRC